MEESDEIKKEQELVLYYFNQEHVISLINEIKISIKEIGYDSSILNQFNESSSKMRLFPESLKIEEENSPNENQLKRNEINEKLKKLKNEINNEIQSIYKSYLQYEKNIFTKVNSLLQEKESIKQMNFVKLVNKISYLEQIYNDIYKFINFFQKNMQLLKEILYEIDESLINENQNHSCISIQLIGEKLSSQSDLNYMLEYKIIDEIIVVIPELLNYYSEVIAFNKFQVDNYLPDINENVEQEKSESNEEASKSLNSSLYQELSKDKEINFYKLKKLQKATTKELKQKENELNLITFLDTFRYKFQNLGILIKYRYKYIKSMGMNDLAFQGSKSDGFLNPHYDEECLIQNFIPKDSFKEYSSSKRKAKGNIVKSITVFLIQQFVYESVCSTYLYWWIADGLGLFLGRILSRLLFGFLLKFEFFHNYRLLSLISFLAYGVSSYTIEYITSHEDSRWIHFLKLFLNGIGNPACVFELFISRYCPRTVFKEKLLLFNNIKYCGIAIGFFFGYGQVKGFLKGYIILIIFLFQCISLLSIAFIDIYNAREEQYLYQNKELSNEELNVVLKAEERLIEQQNYNKNNYIEDNIKEIIQNEKKKMKLKYFIFVLQILIISIIKLDSMLVILMNTQYKPLLCLIYLLGFITAIVIERKFDYSQFTMVFIICLSLIGASFYIFPFVLFDDDNNKVYLLYLTLYCFLIINKLIFIKVSFEIPQNVRIFGVNTYLSVSLIRGISFTIAFLLNKLKFFRLTLVILHIISLLYSYFLSKPKTLVRVAQNYVIG